jgi:large subunit ribosomal protein L25
MAIFKLKADLRENLLKSHTKQLRNEGLVPGVYYYHGHEPQALAVDKRTLLSAIRTNAHIFELEVGKKVYKTIIKAMQWHPVSDEPIHVDFMGVNETEKIEISVKVECVGTARGVKEQGGLLSQSVWHLPIKCLIKDIPENIVVDVTALNMGDSIALKDLEVENVEFVDSPEKSIVSVIAPKGTITLESEEEEGEVEEGAEEETEETTDEE